MKFLFSNICILFVYIIALPYAHAEKDYRQESQNIKTQIHAEITKGKTYTRTIEVFIKKISYNDRKLNTILGKVAILEKKINSQNNLNKKEQQILLLLAYIKYEIYKYVTPIVKEEIEEFPVEEAISDPEIGKIPFFQIGESEFDSLIGTLSPSKRKDMLKEIYEKFSGVPPHNVNSHLAQEIKKVTSWYTPGGDTSRDGIRISDLRDIRSAIETYYGKHSMYPSYPGIRLSIPEMPKDEMGGVIKNNCRFGYIYEVWNNRQDYRISSCLESPNDLRVTTDGGIDNARYELGTDVSYHGRGRQHTNNSDIFYFSLVDDGSDGGSVVNYGNWVTLDPIANPTADDILKIMLDMEYQKDNPWIDKNLVLYHTLNIIASSIDNYFLNGSILEIINHNSSLAGKGLFISGKLKSGENYKVGEVDARKLGIDKKSLVDTTGKPVILGYADTGWGHYQVLGFGQEISGGRVSKKVIIRGTYSPTNRTLEVGKDFRVTGEDTIQIIDASLIYLFKRGEGISENASIIWIDYDTNTLTLDSNISGVTEIVFDQPDGLIFDAKTGLPYKDGDVFSGK